MDPRGFRFTGLLIAAVLCSDLGTAVSREPAGNERELGEIRHLAVSEAPLPRDRADFGIGEQVFFWVETPVVDAWNRPDADVAKRSPGFVVWTASDLSTVLPTVTQTGDRTIVSIGLSGEDRQFDVGVAKLDHRPLTDDRTEHWQPAESEDAALLGVEADEDMDWKTTLHRLIELRQPRKTPFKDVERLAREIFSRPLTAPDQALVYFHLAELYAQSGMIYPERVLAYSRRALDRPLDPIRRTTLSIYRGDACLASRSNMTFDERRQLAAIEYLRGLAEIAWHELPAKPRLRKLAYSYDVDDVAGPEEAKQMQEVRDYNARVDFETTLMQHRSLIRQQLLALGFTSQ